ncbi:MAG TPA: PASTA domain-containing protein, partial [Gemmatimonadaceae bacterium]|nr:PASTA domain-containing protein [Gemmatimonadaceae bacterium]
PNADDAPTRYVVELPATPRPGPVAVTPRSVPDVSGMAIREAVRALHNAGFRVRLLNAASSGTSPAAGTVAAPGTIVQLVRPVQ